MGTNLWNNLKHLRLRCNFVTMPCKHLEKQGVAVDRQTEVQGSASGVRRQTLHDAAIAAVTLGSGLGVHYADTHGPLVASASVLAAALVSRHHYSGELDNVRGEVRLVQAQLEALRLQLQSDREADFSRLSWVANVSHEIRSPLSAVVALGDVLEGSRLDDDQKSLLRDIREAGQMVLDVVNDTLDLAKAESGRLKLQPRPFSLSALCHRVGRLGGMLSARTAPIRVTVSAASPDRLVGDEVRLQQVLLNLVSNAVKYGAGSDIEIACEGLESADDGLWRVTFRVRDHGAGLSAEEQQDLFKPYSRLQPTDRGPQGGTGLGLYLCDRLVHLMGGTIGVHSQPGQGCEFWFTVPLRRAEEIGSRLPTQAQAAQATVGDRLPRLAGRLIAVVDDARLSREVARRIIESEGGVCRSYASGELFLEQAQTGQLALDLVLMDLELCGLDGYETCRHLRALEGYGAVPVIAVSGQEVEAPALQNSGMNGHVLKPFHADALVNAITLQLT